MKHVYLFPDSPRARAVLKQTQVAIRSFYQELNVDRPAEAVITLVDAPLGLGSLTSEEGAASLRKTTGANPLTAFLPELSRACEGEDAEDTLLLIYDHFTPEFHPNTRKPSGNNDREWPKVVGSAIRPVTNIRLTNHLPDGEPNRARSCPIVILGLVPQHQYRHLSPENLFINSPGTHYFDLARFIRLLQQPADAELEQLLLRPRELRILDVPIYKYASKARWIPNYLFHAPFRRNSDRRHSAAGLYGWAMIRSFVIALGSKALKEKSEYGHFDPGSWADPRLSAHLDIHAEQILYGFAARNEQVTTLIDKNFDGIHDQLRVIESQLQKTGSQIGLIDDEATEMKFSSVGGWATALRALTGQEHKHTIVDILETDKKRSVGDNSTTKNQEELNEQVLSALQNSEFNFSCLLIDIRLLPHIDDRNPKTRGRIEHLSGTKLIQEIRKRHPSIPILVFTASNKDWKHKYLNNICKVDAIWVKEGADESRSPERSFFNVVRLLELIKRVTGPKYQFLYRVSKGVDAINNTENNYWWSDPTTRLKWKNGKDKRYGATVVEDFNVREKITGQLKLLQLTLKDYLYNTELIFSEMDVFKSQNPELHYNDHAKILSILIGKIIEIIHGYRNIEDRNQPWVNNGTIGWFFDRNKNKFVANRLDYIAFWLYEHRNESAHFFDNVPFVFFQKTLSDPEGKERTNRSLAQLISTLFAYLTCNTKKFPYHGGSEWKQLIKDLIKDKKEFKRKASKDFINVSMKRHAHIERHLSNFYSEYDFYYHDIKRSVN